MSLHVKKDPLLLKTTAYLWYKMPSKKMISNFHSVADKIAEAAFEAGPVLEQELHHLLFSLKEFVLGNARDNT
jgi:hypothetical protein